MADRNLSHHFFIPDVWSHTGRNTKSWKRNTVLSSNFKVYDNIIWFAVYLNITAVYLKIKSIEPNCDLLLEKYYIVFKSGNHFCSCGNSPFLTLIRTWCFIYFLDCFYTVASPTWFDTFSSALRHLLTFTNYLKNLQDFKTHYLFSAYCFCQKLSLLKE